MNHENAQFDAFPDVLSELRSGRDPLPFVLEIHPTDFCNQRCHHCFHEGSGYSLKGNKTELSFEQYVALFEEMSALQMRHLSISGGGEPTLDSRFPSLIHAAKRNGLSVRVVSNGNHMPQPVLEALLECAEVRVSLDANTGKTYAKIKRISEGLYGRTLENIDRLSDAKRKAESAVQIGVTFILSKDNYFELEDFVHAMLPRDINSVTIKSNIYGDGNVSSTELATLREKILQITDPRIDFRPTISMAEQSLCIVPYFKIALNPYGEVYSCCLGSQPGEKNGYLLGSVASSSFLQVWQQSSEIRKGMRETGVACTSCNHTDIALNERYHESLPRT